MKKFEQDNIENILLLKSIVCVLLIAGGVLLLMRHAAPEKEKSKFYGGGVSLILAHTPEDASDFRRWAELNDPGRIFGYQSAGIFFQAIDRKPSLTLPAVRVIRRENYDTPFYQPAAQKSISLEIERRNDPVTVTRADRAEKKRSFSAGGVPVYDEKGNLTARLEGIPHTNMINALLIRIRKNMAGAECRVIESSGDRIFDNRVAGALGRLLEKRDDLSGILAVWPDSKEIKK